MFRYEIMCNTKEQLEFVKSNISQITQNFKVDQGQVERDFWMATVRFELEQQYSLTPFKGHCTAFWVHRKDPRLIEDYVLVESHRSDTEIPELEAL